MERLLLSTGDKSPLLKCSGRPGPRRLLSISGMSFGNGMVILLQSGPCGKYHPSLKSESGQSIRSQACARNCDDVPDLMRSQLSQLAVINYPQRPDDRAIWQDRRYATVTDPNVNLTCRCVARQSILLVPSTASTVSVEPETGAKQIAGVTVLTRTLDPSGISDFALAPVSCTSGGANPNRCRAGIDRGMPAARVASWGHRPHKHGFKKCRPLI